MKISITTDDGEVVDIIKDYGVRGNYKMLEVANDIGNLSKPEARADLIERIRQAWIKASAMEMGAPEPVATQVEVSPELVVAAEFGYKCCEKGMNIQAAVQALVKTITLPQKIVQEERKREVRIDKNERGWFECWEPHGCGPDKHALFATMPTMAEAVSLVIKTHQKCGLELVSLSVDRATFKLNL